MAIGAVRCLRPGDRLVPPERRRPRAGRRQGRGLRRAARRHGHDRVVLARVLWVAVGLSPIVLAVTGLTMQLVRRNKRKRRANAANVPIAT